MMSALELVLRVAAFTQLCVLILVFFRSGANQQSYRYAAILLLGVACYVLAPLVVNRWHWGLASYPVILMAIVVPALFWYFANAVFEDDFAPRLWIRWLVVATALLGFASFCANTNPEQACRVAFISVPNWIANTAKLLWVVAAFFAVLKDWHADLVESRRRLRLLIVVAGGCYMGVIIIVELGLKGSITPVVELVNVSVLLLALSALCVYFLTLNPTNVFTTMAKSTPQSGQKISPMATELVALMERERAYALDPLTVETLADRLRTQPHRLRQVINGELGYRNFNAFINLYRIREVAGRLEQAEFRNTPLLTLALDAGFRSLAPFNRSFKDHFHTTPSEYRQNLKKEID